MTVYKDAGLIFDTTAVSADVQSDPLDTGRDLTIIGCTYSWTGNIVATSMYWQGRNLPTEEWATVKDNDGNVIYFATIPAGTASNAAQSFKDAGFRFYRVYVDVASGTGAMTMFANTKVEL